MKVRKVPMFYDQDFDRWRIETMGQTFGLHCGEAIEIHLNESTLIGRLEFGRTWYIFVDGVPFALLTGRRYTVSIL